MEMQSRDAVEPMLTVGEDVIGIFRGNLDELLKVDDGRDA